MNFDPVLTALTLVCGSLAIASAAAHQNIAAQVRTLLESWGSAKNIHHDGVLSKQIKLFFVRFWILTAIHIALYLSFGFLVHFCLSELFGRKNLHGSIYVHICLGAAWLWIGGKVLELTLGFKTLGLAGRTFREDVGTRSKH